MFKGFFGRLFGSSEAGNTLIEGGINAIDKLVYTREEEAEDKAKAKTELMSVYMAWLTSTSGSRLARRLLALIVTGIWAAEHVTSVVLRVFSVFTNDSGALTSDKFIAAADMLSTEAIDNTPLVGVVLLFYFGGPAAVEGVKGLVMKWTEKK